MPKSGDYRALSLDLWSTCLLEAPGLDDRLRTARLRFLQQNLRSPEGGPTELWRVEHAIRIVTGELHARGRGSIEVDPAELIELDSRVLGTTPAKTYEELGREYSAIGFAEDAPETNPEAERLVSAVEARGMPVIAITNTGRREESWQEFFRTRTGLRFSHVVTSCEVGRAKPHEAIFNEASRRLKLGPGAILHIGDRWELDARGALDAGFGAVLYTGLWESRPGDGYPQTNLEEVARAGVPCFSRLDDPRLLDLLA